jgi:hypothetical protein
VREALAHSFMTTSLAWSTGLLPVMERLGLAADLDIDGVADRLRAAAVASNACIMPPPLVGAWAQMLP